MSPLANASGNVSRQLSAAPCPLTVSNRAKFARFFQFIFVDNRTRNFEPGNLRLFRILIYMLISTSAAGNTTVHPATMLQGSAGTQLIQQSQPARMISLSANAPVFATHESGVDGEAGGTVEKSASWGRIAPGMAVRTLSWERLYDIFLLRDTGVYAFILWILNYRGLGKIDLPPGSVVINLQPTFWQARGQWIITGIFLLLAEGLVIVALIWQRAKANKKRIELVRSSDRLRLAMETGKTAGWEFNLASRTAFLLETCVRSLGFHQIRLP